MHARYSIKLDAPETPPRKLREDSEVTSSEKKWTRRKFLAFGGGGLAVAAVGVAGGIELISHGVLPGAQTLDQLDGGCSVLDPPLVFSALGPSLSSTFYSKARNRNVGYTIAYPPGYSQGSALPLVVMLHGFGGDHVDALAGMSPAQAVALHIDGKLLAPMAIVTVDGGDGYWNPHPRDNPMGMVVDELIPMCQRLGLGQPPHGIGTMGISMGGYGALLIAEKYPHLIAAVGAISPAIWTSYAEARAVNARAYASLSDFTNDDVVTHTSSLAAIPVRVASGYDDPFHPGVQALARSLPPGATVEFANGCHTDSFFLSQEPATLAFLSKHLSA